MKRLFYAQCTYIKAEDMIYFDIYHALEKIQSTQIIAMYNVSKILPMFEEFKKQSCNELKKVSDPS